MAKENKEFYLGKNEMVYGPFGAIEIEKLYASGEIRAFTYLWAPSATAWKPLEPLPPNPLEHAREQKEASRTLKAVCHDSRFSLVAGSLQNVTDSGCDLVADDPSACPRLGLKSSLTLNVLDPSTGKSVNVKIRMANVRRQAGRWIYRVQWSSPPALQSVSVA